MNTYSLGNNFGYTDWQTAGNEGNLELFCPDSSIVVGYEGRTGDWMDQFLLICKYLNSDGTLGDTTHTGTNGGSEGGSFFGPYILEGNQGLVGFQANQSTLSASHLASIQGYGQSIEYIASGNENSSNYSILPWLGPNDTSVQNLGTQWVPNGYVIVGMQITGQEGYVGGVVSLL